MVFQESLIHFIWRFRLFNQQNLRTVDGEELIIHEVGQYNHDAGPDFMFAKLKIDNTTWSGNVEIHVKEEDWLLHKHQLDASYDNTILHVVWETSARSVVRIDGTKIPTLRIQEYIDHTLLDKYSSLMHNVDWIPCVHQLSSVRELTIRAWVNRMTVARLEQKVAFIQKKLVGTNYDWESVFYVVLGRSFGMKVNADAFERLCSNLNLQLINKYKADPDKVESLLFGIAGFLDRPQDDYGKKRRDEFSYLQQLHGLIKMDAAEWRFLRMRPYNFPTYRLAQLATLLQLKKSWFSFILETEDLKEILASIDDSIVNPYWQNHYRFNNKTAVHSTSWSVSFKYHLVINCFVPLLFSYGDYMKLEGPKNKALDWLNELPAEVNQITKRYATYHVVCQSAADSQGLLYMKSQYCAQKQCLDCAIGLEILKKY